MDQGFERIGDLPSELAALKGAPDPVERERAAPPIRRSAWRGVLSFLKSLRYLNLTRHRAALLEEALAQSRRELEDLRLDLAVSQAEARAAESAIREELAPRAELLRQPLQTKHVDDTLARGIRTIIDPPTQAALDRFYFELEDRYRGSREEIAERLSIYRPDLMAARERTGVEGPVIDLGCGRGELLELIGAWGLKAVGVDSNQTQLDQALQRGCEGVKADALAYMQSMPGASAMAVSAIHVAEHLPFPRLVALLQQAHRVLRSGGLLLLETPNPRNLIVGATTFHFDPTHIKPLPPEMLVVLLESLGFSEVETRPLHPSPTGQHMIENHGLDPHIAHLLFGPQDYAALGVKA